ncbi:hypothetical protein HORM4_620084 [Vibrio harveyi]|nr:hypothetical protein HORM4_620084 [Vibrio harveyi]
MQAKVNIPYHTVFVGVFTFQLYIRKALISCANVFNFIDLRVVNYRPNSRYCKY